MVNETYVEEIAEKALEGLMVKDEDNYTSVLQLLINWINCAFENTRNSDFYRDLLDDCAKLLGPEVYVSDDGSIQNDPIRLKIPELIKKRVDAINNVAPWLSASLSSNNDCCKEYIKVCHDIFALDTRTVQSEGMENSSSEKSEQVINIEANQTELDSDIYLVVSKRIALGELDWVLTMRTGNKPVSWVIKCYKEKPATEEIEDLVKIIRRVLDAFDNRPQSTRKVSVNYTD